MNRLLSALIILALIGCDARRPSSRPGEDGKEQDKTAVEWPAIGKTAAVGDVTITLAEASRQEYRGRRDGKPATLAVLRVAVDVHNASATDVLHWKGMSGHPEVAAEDERGDALAPAALKGFMREDGKPLGEPDGPRRVEPKQTSRGYLYFQMPAASAEEVRLTLPLSVIDAKLTKAARFRAPITRPKE